MGKKTSSPPPAPDPYAVANAQTGSNIETAIANTVMGNANEVTPFGTVGYQIIGSQNIGGRDIPRYERITSLSPEQQQLYDQQTQIGLKSNAVALSQADKIAGILGQDAPATPTLMTLGQALGGADPQQIRDRAEAALMDRLNPQLDRDRSALEARLVNQGLVRGTEAFNTSADEFGRQANDARLAAIGQAGTEADRTYNQAQQVAGFDNSVAMQNWTNQLQSRVQPINEISTLMGLGQVPVPQAPQYQAGEVAGTPVGQYVYQTAQQNYDTWKTQEQQKSAQLGSLFGLGGAVAGAVGTALGRRK